MILWLLTILLALRVLGQVIVAWRAPRWLPPFDQWESGLVPYPFLLGAQVGVLTLMTWAAADLSRGAGVFFAPRWPGAIAMLWFSYAYAGAMGVRYIIQMARHPDQRWLGGTIPIVFHTVVALFLWVFAQHHLGRALGTGH